MGVVVLCGEQQIIRSSLLFVGRPASTAGSRELVKHVLSVQMENVEEMSTTHSMWIKIKEPLTDILPGKQTKASEAFAALKGARTHPPTPRPEKPPERGILVPESKHGCKLSWMSSRTAFLVYRNLRFEAGPVPKAPLPPLSDSSSLLAVREGAAVCSPLGSARRIGPFA